MENAFPLQSTPRTAAEYKAAMEWLLVELDLSNQKMEKDRKDIERLKAETDTLKAETPAIFSTSNCDSRRY